LSETFCGTLARVAALVIEIETGMQSTRAIHVRSSICHQFTAIRQLRTLMFANLDASLRGPKLTRLPLLGFRTRLRSGRFLGRLLLLAQQAIDGPNQLRDFVIAFL